MPWLGAVFGLALLLLAGDALVRGAVNLALRAGVPALLVSLTIVAFGTSAPELLVSVQAVLDGAPGIAVGNVVGSNIANVLLVLGVPALLTPMRTDVCDVRGSYVQMLGATGLFIGLAARGVLGFWSGALLFWLLLLMLYWTGRGAIRGKADADLPEAADTSMSALRIAFFLIAGLVGLPLGAHLLIESASEIARTFGLSESVIGLTLVAVGTSLPELATTVMAAIRRQSDVAIGNVIGSNLFNLFGIMGLTAMVHPVVVPQDIVHLDVWIMAAASLVLGPVVFLRLCLGRIWGLALTASYATYLVAVLV